MASVGGGGGWVGVGVGVASVARVANSINIDYASSKGTPRSEKWSRRVYSGLSTTVEKIKGFSFFSF